MGRLPLYTCSDGMCGALDCARCHPGGAEQLALDEHIEDLHYQVCEALVVEQGLADEQLPDEDWVREQVEALGPDATTSALIDDWMTR